MLAPVTAPGPSPARAVLKAGHVKQITSFFQNMTVAPEPSGAQRQKSRLSHSSGVPANNKENVVVADDDCDSPLLGKGRVRADCCCLVRTSRRVAAQGSRAGKPSRHAEFLRRAAALNVALSPAHYKKRL